MSRAVTGADGFAYAARPGLGPLVYGLLGALAAGRCALWLGTGSLLPVALASCAVGAVLWAAARALGGSSAAALAWTVCSLAMLAGCWAGLAGWERAREALAAAPMSSLEFEVTRDGSKGSQGWSVLARATAPGGCLGTVWLRTEGPIEPGTAVSVAGRFSPAADDEFGRSCRARGVAGSVRALRVTGSRALPGLYGQVLRARSWLLEPLSEKGGDGAALLAGAVLGRRAQLDEAGLSDAFGASGLAHLTAVSGAHLVLVSSAVSAALFRARARPGARCLWLACATGVYVLLCGAPVSAVRSWLMSGVAGLSAVAGRRAHSLSALCAVALALCLANPAVTGELGYLLSVASVAALCLFSRHVSELANALVRAKTPVPCPPSLWGVKRRALAIARGLRNHGATSLACACATAPLCAASFGSVSLAGPLANMVLGPLFTGVMALGALGVVAARVPVLGPAALSAACGLGDAFCSVVRAVAVLPFAQVPVEAAEPAASLAVVGAMAAFYLWWPCPEPRTLRAAAVVSVCAAAVVLAALPWLQGARMVVLDVGQGDAILVQDGPARVLVDLGGKGSLAPALCRNAVTGLSAAVLTHQHDDHYGGLGDLAGYLRLPALYLPAGAEGSLCDEVAEAAGLLSCEVRPLCHGETLRVGRWSLEVLWPREEVDATENDQSLVLRAVFDEAGARGEPFTALLTGDAERDVLGAVAAEAGDVDMLKVGHHGSEASVTAAEARVLSPEVAVASAGEGNSYGHPDPACVSVLEEAGARFVCTKDAGDVELRPRTEGFALRCRAGSVS